METELDNDPRRAGPCGFSRTEVGALLVVVAISVVLGLYGWWERRSMASAPGWVIEDVVLNVESRPSLPRSAGTVADHDDSLGRERLPTETSVDVNRATLADLVRLPGIGPQLAARIIQDRQSRGPFTDLADMQRVRGIGPKNAAALAGWVRFTSPGRDSIGREGPDTTVGKD
ncbi:MAG: helix-hairpin-helix domain-containing protein [Candidatus Zixiibacteriota bacterium]